MYYWHKPQHNTKIENYWHFCQNQHCQNWLPMLHIHRYTMQHTAYLLPADLDQVLYRKSCPWLVSKTMSPKLQ
jgi:hypothetical protein